MAYDYYRSSFPGWGTSQFQLGSPPPPMFQPQPSWGGLDFYNAHAINPDPAFYNSIMSRSSAFGSMGLGREEARYWHRRIYSGITPLVQALSADIGAASAYEAYRMWKRNTFLYEPLSADRLAQREGLIGMAIGEATRLWQCTGRALDTYGLRNACEAAAAAASALADRWLSYTYGGGVAGMGLGAPGVAPSYASSGGAGYGGYRGRRSSFGGLAAGGSPLLGAGAMGGSPYMGAGAPGAGGLGASPMLGAAGGLPARGVSPIPGTGLVAGAMGGGVGAMGAGVAGPGPTMGGVGAGGLGMGAPAMGAGMGAAGLGAGAGMGGGMGMGAPYSGGGMGMNVQSVPPGSTIIYERPSRSRHRHHRRSPSRGRHRARSVDVITTGGAGYGAGGYGAGGMGGPGAGGYAAAMGGPGGHGGGIGGMSGYGGGTYGSGAYSGGAGGYPGAYGGYGGGYGAGGGRYGAGYV